MSQEQPRRTQEPIRYWDVFNVVGDLASQPIAPQDAAAMQSAENQLLGKTQRGRACSRDNSNIAAGDGTPRVGISKVNNDGNVLVTEEITGQVALEAAAPSNGDRPVDQSDATAIQAVEIVWQKFPVPAHESPTPFLPSYCKRLYKDGTSIANHVNDFLGIIQELANLGIKFDDEMNGLILLNTLPESWESFRSTMINSSLDGKKNLTWKENKQDLVYFDVCDPLKNKSQVFKYFQHYHAMVERETGLKPKCLRADNGREYTSKEFKDYCSKHGIRHEKTVHGTPQHNGIAKWMNRTIMEKTMDQEKKKTVRSRDVVFHEHEKINDLKEEKATRSSRQGVEDLTPTKTPSREITNEEKVQVLEDEIEEPTIEEDQASVDGGSNEQGEQPQPKEEKPQLRRSTREHKPFARYPNSDYILIIEEGESKNFHKLDVKAAFLHGDLHEEIYMDQPEGFEEEGKEGMVCKLKKSLYGLKQAPRQWYKKFDSFMTSHGYKRTNANPCVYIRSFPNGNFIILLLYVDDMLILGQDVEKICKLKLELSKSFNMKDLGPAKQILGMASTCDKKARKLWLSQEKYVERMLERFNMKHAKPVSTPFANHFKLSKQSCLNTKEEKEKMSSIPYSSAVGSLMYAMVCTQPNIAYAVGVTEPILKGYTDADMAGCYLELPAEKPVTNQVAEAVIVVELRNKPDMNSTPVGVGATMATAAKINSQNKTI
ncbi:hypothetical protein SLEP1_g36885 [Rubroshorea leprosula]|uniref:Integrase catalytic domain-containing protein n=1 Tax=Rubroshorea leprosula TaxID=152421 RepID=A0AAV5KSZ1_9ROSI|nr:hypothetical protein SLEP1_g36885 [Rubroshorea leprosula]